MSSKLLKLRSCLVATAGLLVVALPGSAVAAPLPQLSAQFAETSARSVVKDGAYTANVVVTNTGDAPAVNTALSVSAGGSANEFSPSWTPHPAFAPELAYTAGCAAVTSSCSLGTIAPGETRVVQVTVSKITHYGTLRLNAFGWHDAGSTAGGYNSWSVQVTNGKSAIVQVDAEAPASASGNADILVRGEISTAGPDVIDNGLLYIDVTPLNDSGTYYSSYQAGQTEVSSIRSLKLSNGTTCGAKTDVISAKPYINRFVCPVNGLASKTRLTFELLLNFPTARKDLNVGIEGTLASTAFLASGSNAGFVKNIELNPSKSVDLQTTITTQAVIGRDRIAPVSITVKNVGPSLAEGVSLGGDARGGVGGTFDRDTLPKMCSGIHKPIYTRCGLGSIESGKSVTFVINVRAANKLGVFAPSFGASHANWRVQDTNLDNNAATATFDVIKANAVPFRGVKEVRPARQNMGQLLRSGARTTLTCPSGCKATVSLQVRRNVAERLGLVKKRARRAKALPYVVVGAGVKARNRAGKVVVVAKVSRAYRVKLAKLRVPLSLSRVTKVVATEKSVRGATYMRSNSMVVRPARRR